MSQDVIDLMCSELTREAFHLPLYDADARELWMARCVQVLAAIHDPDARASQAVNFAMGLALRGVPSPLVLRQFGTGEQP